MLESASHLYGKDISWRQGATARALASQCFIFWAATDASLSESTCSTVIHKAMSACRKLGCNHNPMLSSYCLLTCLACKDEPGALRAFEGMKKAEGLTNEYVLCMQRLALAQDMTRIAFDLRNLALQLWPPLVPVKQLIDTVLLGIDATAGMRIRSPTDRVRCVACHRHCNQVMLALVPV